MADLQIVELEKACNSQAALTAAYRAAMKLQEAGWTRYPCVGWDDPAIVAFEGDQCVAGINYTAIRDDLIFTIDFAWCTKASALAPVLLRARAKMRDSRCTHVSFTCHEGNEAMAKAVSIMGAQPFSHTYRMAITR